MDSKIEHVFFHKNEKGQIEAWVVYQDGSEEIVDRETGVNKVISMATQNGITNINELVNKGYFRVYSNEKQFDWYVSKIRNIKSIEKNKSNNIYDTDDNTNDNENIFKRMLNKIKPGRNKHGKEGIFTKIKRKVKKHKFLTLALLLATIPFTMFTSKKVGDLNLFNNKTTDDKKKNEKEINEAKQSIHEFKSMDDALSNANINNDKRTALKTVWKYINNYNVSTAKFYKEKGQNHRLAHTWNEIMASYLAYNSMEQSRINNIFDSYKFDADRFNKAYKDGIEQDIQAYMVITDSLGKDDLIENADGKNFYINYEKMIIEFNSLKKNSDVTRQSVANKFYKQVKRDFINGKMKSYKLSVIPIIKAFNRLTKDMSFKEKLSTAEQKELHTTLAHEKFEKYEKNLQNSRIALKALGVNQDEVAYLDLKQLAVEELKNINAYNVGETARDISSYKKYTNNKKLSQEAEERTTNDSKENETAKSNAKTIDNSKKESKKTTDSSKKESKKDSKKTTDHSKKKKASKPAKIEEDSNSNIETANAVIDEINDVPDDIITDDSNDNFNEITDMDNNSSDSTVDDSTIDKDSDSSIDSSTTIDDSYKNGDGEIDDSVKDITTDGSSAVSGDEQLPDPNQESNTTIDDANTNTNEVIADAIIESMANDQTVDDTAKVYTK